MVQAKKVEDRQKRLELDEVQEAERAVKKETMKRPEVFCLNILDQKLVHLEDMARRMSNTRTKLYVTLLQCFAFY